MQCRKSTPTSVVILLPVCFIAMILFPTVPAGAAGPGDPAELEAFLDGFLASAMER